MTTDNLIVWNFWLNLSLLDLVNTCKELNWIVIFMSFYFKAFILIIAKILKTAYLKWENKSQVQFNPFNCPNSVKMIPLLEL